MKKYINVKKSLDNNNKMSLKLPNYKHYIDKADKCPNWILDLGLVIKRTLNLFLWRNIDKTKLFFSFEASIYIEVKMT